MDPGRIGSRGKYSSRDGEALALRKTFFRSSSNIGFVYRGWYSPTTLEGEDDEHDAWDSACLLRPRRDLAPIVAGRSMCTEPVASLQCSFPRSLLRDDAAFSSSVRSRGASSGMRHPCSGTVSRCCFECREPSHRGSEGMGGGRDFVSFSEGQGAVRVDLVLPSRR
jgi:hypothetical protein